MQKLSYLEELINRYKVRDPRRCEDASGKILSWTGHIPSVTSVANAAARCRYYARMVESIGVKAPYEYRERISGRGDDVHKILGLAVLALYEEYGSLRSSADPGAFVDRVCESDADLVSCKEGKVEEARALLRRLLNMLPRLCEVVGTSPNRLFPLVEQQLASYEVHMKGVPDLILEDRDGRRAIVVDWKTGDEKMWKTDEAQVVAYSILEAMRLGYNVSEVEEAILGRLSGSIVKDVKILPIIIRRSERTELKPHPALAPVDKVEDRYQELRDLIKKVLEAAEFLTMIVTNHERFVGRDLEESCSTYIGGGKRVKLLRMSPPSLPAGNPKKQNSYPCASSNGKIICSLAEDCKFYFGEFGEDISDEEKRIWYMRYKIFEDKEQQLLIYRALEELFKRRGYDVVLERMREGQGIICDIRAIDYRFERFYAARGRRIDRKILIRLPFADSRADDHIEKRYELLSVEMFERNAIKASRLFSGYEGSEKGGEGKYDVIPPGSTVFVSFMDGTHPYLSINVFSRVADVDVQGNRIVYILDSPSSALKYQMRVAGRYIEVFRKMGRKPEILVVEADVDLTKIELETLHIIQRMARRDREGVEGQEEAVECEEDSWDIECDELSRELPDIIRSILR
jgi:hypothetical protein